MPVYGGSLKDSATVEYILNIALCYKHVSYHVRWGKMKLSKVLKPDMVQVLLHAVFNLWESIQ